ncbi:MAG TPA: Rrf2 family transcriptional regulator [Gemmatimonadota bacterium]|jgi:Rrf2 family protein|nr:Rrf2 family transcriptional regulator [Gemmatimonadota bacterium]
MLSKTAQYALRAVIYLAGGSGAPVPAAEVAAGLEVPPNYLSKILHTLSRAGVVESERGPGGGYRLARPADRIPIADVVGEFEPLAPGGGCLLGFASCPGEHPCPAHERWQRVSEPIAAFFRETMVSELLESSGAVAPTVHA